MFSELASRLGAVDSPYDLWVELWLAFKDAYDATPPDESLIKRVYRYSDWCCVQERGKTAADDLFTCVCVSFYEQIPLHPKARHDMPRWWRVEDLENGPAGEPNMMAYNLSAEEFEELKRFLEKERHRYDPSLW